MAPLTLGMIIGAIEQQQPVINKNELPVACPIRALASLSKAGDGDLSFIASSAYQKMLISTQATAVLVDSANKGDVPKTTLAVVVADPYLAYASASQLFTKPASSQISPHSIIGDNVVIGEGVYIGAGAIIGDNVVIGEGCRLDRVDIYPDCQLGVHCRVYSNATIGADGFGFAPYGQGKDGRRWQPIAQLGRVVIGDRVSIGAGTCIDRGALDDTMIGDDVIIDNLVQIAHNVVIGAGTAIAAGTGIAGSTTIGKRCMIGGAVGIVGHIDISDDVTITAMSMVTKSIKTAGSYSSGTVAMPTKAWRRAAVRFRQLGD